MTTGVELIAEERRHQLEDKYFDGERDDRYTSNELARAAIHIAASAIDVMICELFRLSDPTPQDSHFPYRIRDVWPDTWGRRWDPKEKDNGKRQLVIAGALIAAELDRLLRKEEAKEKSECPEYK